MWGAGDGTGRQVITTDTNDSQPAFSPNGQELAYIHHGRLSIIRASGGKPHAVLQDGLKSCPGQVSFPSWSPNGRTLVFVGCGGGSPPVICLVHANGTHRRCLLHNIGLAAAFSPNGRWIVYAGFADGQRGALYKVHLNGTNTTRITPVAQTVGGVDW